LIVPSLLKVLRKERDTMASLTSLGLNATEAIEALTHPAIAKAQSSAAQEGLFDASDREEGGGVIVWWNNLETDSRYQAWGNTLQEVRVPF
jgi:UDP-glucose:glycoprotein glucosyltransferase